MVVEKKIIRKLRAIVSADVKGYSLLMSQDEIHTIRTLTEYRQIMSEFIVQHSGRVVDSPGDNLLAEFESAVDAVQCTVKIQMELKKRNENLTREKRLEFRIGINIGDIVKDRDRIYGEGVNIAARIEGLSKSGGICISRNVYDQVKNKLELVFEYIGEQSVKNISYPIYIYKILLNPEDSEFIFGKPKKFEIPEKPSIAVLPLDNMSGDPKFEYVCDAITEEIITGLANIPLLFVIARNSSNVYKGQQVKIKKIGQELGVQYVLEGSIQKSDHRIRVIVQLIDSVNDRHLWAERYEGVLTDLFAFQDEITVKILSALQIKLEHGHKSNIWDGATTDIIALQKYLQAHDALFKNADLLSTRKLIEEAHNLDSNFVIPYVFLGWIHMFDAWLGLSESPEMSICKALELGEKAVKLNRSMAPAYSLLGKIYYTMGDVEKGIKTARRAVEINPNDADCHAHLGCLLTYTGYPEEALFWINRAVRLNPEASWVYFLFFGQAYNLLERYEEAIAAYQKVIERTPDNPFALIGLVEGYCLLGDTNEARKAAREVHRVYPDFSAQYHVKAMVYRYEKDSNRFLQALRKAGLN